MNTEKEKEVIIPKGVEPWEYLPDWNSNDENPMPDEEPDSVEEVELRYGE